MSETSKKSEPLPGSSGQWDDIWTQYSGDDTGMKKLFSRGKPSTIYQFWQRAYFEDFIEIIGERRNGKFLELGSGRGTTSLYLANEGIQDITLLDLSETALSQAVLNFEFEKVPAPKTVLANAEDTGLDSDSFDFIFNIGVLEHFEDPGPILRESFRLLRPGGQIFMPIVPDMPYRKSLICRTLFNPLSIAKQTVKSIIGYKSKVADSGMTRTKNGKKEYRDISNGIGFSDVKCIPYNPYWRVNEDDGFVMNSLALPAYRLHYAFKKAIGVKPFFKSMEMAACCYLLTATKNQVK